MVALAATRRDSGDVLALLGKDRVLVSRDGGYGWTSHEIPAGPPATAMGLRGRDTVKVVIARLGGELVEMIID